MDTSIMSQIRALEHGNRRLKRMQADLLKQAPGKNDAASFGRQANTCITRKAQRRELADKAVALCGVSIDLVCRPRGASETVLGIAQSAMPITTRWLRNVFGRHHTG